MSIKEKGYTVQCINCMCILGISSKNFQEEEIYCNDCATQILNNTENNKNGMD